MKTSSSGQLRLLFVVTEDWYFVSHRLALAVAAKEAGYDVAVATRVDRHGAIIRDAGIRLFDIRFNRSGMRPGEELVTLHALYKLYQRERPDIVHHVAMKPVIYGSLAARAARIPAIVNALGGLGFVFSSTALRARLIQSLVRPALKMAMGRENSRLILQNTHDLETVIHAGLITKSNVRLIRGAGVDPSGYPITTVDVQPPLVILTARLLRQKGVGEFVEAARILRSRGVVARFALVGQPDPVNPASFTDRDVKSWVDEGVIEAWGWREDMPAIFGQAQIACLPTFYGEGLPKVLLEAAASGCAIVASDIPGCRELVKDDETGLLVPPKNPEALADALERLIKDPELRKRLGTAARSSIISDFSLDRIVSETLAVYQELLPPAVVAQRIP